MKSKKYISLMVAGAMFLSSCEESAINNFMVDDTVMLLTPGLVNDPVYVGLDDPYEVCVLKSGKGLQSARVSIAVDETVLDEYNETAAQKLDLMPADCYEFTITSLDLSCEDYQRAFMLNWNRDKLASALTENPDIALPLRMTVESDGVNVNEEKLTTIIQPSMEIPTIKLQSSGLVTGLMPTRQSTIKEDVYMFVSTNFIPSQDIEYTLEIDEKAITDYNEAHNTEYKLLPEAAYTLEPDGWMVKKNMKSARFKFTFNREVLIPEDGASLFGDYILPLKLNCTSVDTDADHDLVLYTVSVVATKIDKSKWQVYSCNSDICTIEKWETVEGDYIADYLIDGTTNTSWRSIWSAQTQLPLDVCIDFGVERSLYKVTIEAPSGANLSYYNAKSGHIEVADSKDGPWRNVAEWTNPTARTKTNTFEITPTTCQYMKFVIDETFDGSSKVMIAELSVWGE